MSTILLTHSYLLIPCSYLQVHTHITVACQTTEVTYSFPSFFLPTGYTFPVQTTTFLQQVSMQGATDAEVTVAVYSRLTGPKAGHWAQVRLDHCMAAAHALSCTKHVWYSEHGTYYQFEFILE